MTVTDGVCGRSLGPLQEQSGVVTWHVKGGAGRAITASFSTCWPLPPWALGVHNPAATLAGAHTPAAAWPGIHALAAASVGSRASHHLSRLWEQVPAGSPHTGGAEIIVKPQGLRNLGNQGGNLPMAAQAADLHLHHWLCKFSTCRASKQTMGAPAAGTGLALTAVGFVVCAHRDWAMTGLLPPLPWQVRCTTTTGLGPDFGGSVLVAF